MIIGRIWLAGVLVMAAGFSGCDQKRQERVAQTEKLNNIEVQLAEIKGNLAVVSERPPVTYSAMSAPVYSPSGSLTLNPNSDAIVQITDFSPAPAAPATRSSTRRAEVARLGQTAPSVKTPKSAAAKKSGKNSKAVAKSNYAKTIAVSGLAARDVQTALKNAGYNPGAIDGKVGPKTVAAIKNFQRVEGLSADGVVGRRTWEKLSAYLSSSASTVGSTPSSSATSDYISASDFTF